LAPAYAAARPGEQRRSVIDPALAAKVLGWKPEVDLDAGLSRTLDWLRPLLKVA
jgi:UDP-glucose 4-epimerase